MHDAPFVIVQIGDYEILVDRQDLPVITEHRWFPRQKGGNLTPAWVSFINRSKPRLTLHRVLAGVRDRKLIVVPGSRGLDMRRSSLKIIPAAAATVFPHGFKKLGNASGYRGVYRNHARYMARIEIDGVQHYLGSFVWAIEAALAYDKAAREAWGSRALTNFPDWTGCKPRRAQEALGFWLGDRPRQRPNQRKRRPMPDQLDLELAAASR